MAPLTGGHFFGRDLLEVSGRLRRVRRSASSCQLNGFGSAVSTQSSARTPVPQFAPAQTMGLTMTQASALVPILAGSNSGLTWAHDDRKPDAGATAYRFIKTGPKRLAVSNAAFTRS